MTETSTLSASPDPLDRLYTLLPAIYRIRDAELGYPLKALLQVMSEQANIIEDDITQLYENWFIETAQDWVVPYIGDLLGYVPVLNAAAEGGEGKALVPRREVANLIDFRRRKGTLALLERLARDIADWPARAVEFFKLLAWAQHTQHLHLDRHRTANLRDMDALDRIGTAFESIAHSVDIRRISSQHTRGLFNLSSVGVFVWRLRSYSVTATPAHCAEDAGPHCFTFSVLGQDAPIYTRPQPEAAPDHIAEELNLPVPIRRQALSRRTSDFYGKGRSFAIWAEGWAGYPSDSPLPVEALIAADLSGWVYDPPARHIAVDPYLGRIAFPRNQLPKRGVRVSYQYGFSADIGGGEYTRPQIQPSELTLYRVGEHEKYRRIADALRQWHKEHPAHAVIEIADSGVYVEPLNIHLGKAQSLQLRAASGVRAVIRIIDWQTDLPDALAFVLSPQSRLTLDGLLVTGRPVVVTGVADEASGERGTNCQAELVIRHCTLVPGWGLDCDCQPERSTEPSLELSNVRAQVRIEHSIVGRIQVQEDEVHAEPIAMSISDSILDSTDPRGRALAGAGTRWAHAVLTIQRSTVFGIVDVHAIALAENCIFTACVNVARRQTGCVRFSYVPSGCRTPKRYQCQPDGVISAVRAGTEDQNEQARQIAGELLRVKPQFKSVHYGLPSYAQLGPDCAPEIVGGADDRSEMGAFHDLFQPQREASLRARLNEYTPAGMDVDIVIES